MTRSILFVGDMHLGRSPHRLAAADLDVSHLGPAEAWRRVQRFAIDREVQAVVLAGDVVDQEKDRFEAFGCLQRGVTRLLDAGIAVVGVAGNHDAIALPRLADRIDGFQLLGAGGHWQRVELDGVDLVGWSFPARHHRRDPLQSPGLSAAMADRRPDALCLGVLHTDLDAGDSPYAPTTRRGLAAQPAAAWFLGHIHQPDTLTGAHPMGYLGSLTGLDRGELGPRGPWLVTPMSASNLRVEQQPLGPVLWRAVDVDASALALDDVTNDNAQDVLHDALMRALTGAAGRDSWLAAGDFAAVGCSVRWCGRTDATDALRQFMASRTAQELVVEVSGVPWAVVSMTADVRPKRDLSALATEATPLGQVAQLLLALDELGDAALPDEVRRAVAAFEPGPWRVGVAQPAPAAPAATTRAAALRLLDGLLRQRVAHGETPDALEVR